MNVKSILTLTAAVAIATVAWAAEREMTTGDGRTFEQELNGDLPARQSVDSISWTTSSFETQLDTNPMQIVDQFSLEFRGGDKPVRVLIEDVTGPTPIVLIDDNNPGQNLSDAGFRRNSWQASTEPCPIVRGEVCSSWMFLGREHRIYRAEITLDNGRSFELFQAEPYNMSSFVERLSDRIPTRQTLVD